MRYKWKCYAATSREFLKRKYECLSPYFFFVPSYYVLPGWSSSNRFEIWGHTLRIVEQQDRRRVTCQWRATFLVLDCFTLNFFHMREKKKKEKSVAFLFLKYFLFTYLYFVGSSFLLGFSLAVASEGDSLVAVHGLLIAVLFLVVEHWFGQVSFK